MDRTDRPQRGFPRPGGSGARFAEAEHAVNARKTLMRLFRYIAGEKAAVTGLFAVVALGTASGVFAPYLQSRAIDMLTHTASGDINCTLLLMTATYVLYCIVKMMQGWLSAGLSQRLILRLRSELFRKLVRLPIPYMDNHSHGDVMSRMTNDIESLSMTFSMSLPAICSGVMMIAGAVSVMAWACWQLTLLSGASLLLTAVATGLLSSPVRTYSRKRQKLLGELNGKAEELVSGFHTVVACGRERLSAEEFCLASDELTRAGISADAVSGIFGPVMNAIGNISFIVIAAFGGYFATNGLISVGMISAFLVYARLLSRPVNELAQVYGQLQTAVAGAERVFMMMDEPEEDMHGEELRPDGSADVKLHHVDFSYAAGKKVLHDLSLDIPTGKKIALVGATGSGKTTVANLLMRFYDADAGRITIGGQDISRVSRGSLRRATAIVLQDTVLFSDTVRNNLLYACPDADDAVLWHAAEMSCCADMIRMLPQGLDTLLASGGSNLSQGQRQLLSIARAFAANPRLLIFDEATANVDTRTEKAIQQAMHKLMKGRTSIVIAHRLSTIRDADLIVVMDQGRSAETGSHQELLARQGKYFELCSLQFSGRNI